MEFREFAAMLKLSPKQTDVYECLFSLGSASASDIVQRTGINRTLVYDHLNVLVERGLVSISVVNNKRMFTALGPRTLVAKLEEDVEELEERKRAELKELKASMAALERQYMAGEKASAGILLGKKGVRNLFRDIVSTLKRGEEDLVFIANYEGRELLEPTILSYYARCAKKGIRVRAIFDSRPRTLKIGGEAAKLPLVRVRFLPAEYAGLTTFHVYGKKTCMLLFSEGEVFGLVVENEKVANGLRKHFEALWRTARA